jgi:hypothetical protein
VFHHGVIACGIPGCSGCEDDPSGASCDVRSNRAARIGRPDVPPAPTESPRGFGAAAHDRMCERRETVTTSQARRPLCTGTVRGRPCVREAAHTGKCRDVWSEGAP